jgi:hypothetical protein
MVAIAVEASEQLAGSELVSMLATSMAAQEPESRLSIKSCPACKEERREYLEDSHRLRLNDCCFDVRYLFRPKQ